MEIITPRRIPEPNMMEYAKKREMIFKEFSKYLQKKGLVRKFQRAEISVDFHIDTASRGVLINPDRFAIYRIDKSLRESVEQDLYKVLLKVKEQLDVS